MNKKSQRGIAYCLVVVFFLIGVICYAGFQKKAPDEPLRIMFKNKGGDVLFSHQNHIDEYGLECESCHHEDPDDPETCITCHNGEDTDVSLADAFHTNCKGCHEEESGPVECAKCHRR